MKQNRRSIVTSLALAFIALPAALLISSLSFAVLAQEGDVPQFRSRSEQLAEQRKIEKAYPELVRALRTLHLPPDKMAEAETKLRRSEVATRATREELLSLVEEESKQGYDRRATNSNRISELRASLQQSDDQLQSEIKTLLTPQQREQFNRHLQRRSRPKQLNRERLSP